jgi:hypothetical protein
MYQAYENDDDDDISGGDEEEDEDDDDITMIELHYEVSNPEFLKRGSDLIRKLSRLQSNGSAGLRKYRPEVTWERVILAEKMRQNIEEKVTHNDITFLKDKSILKLTIDQLPNSMTGLAATCPGIEQNENDYMYHSHLVNGKDSDGMEESIVKALHETDIEKVDGTNGMIDNLSGYEGLTPMHLYTNYVNING